MRKCDWLSFFLVSLFISQVMGALKNDVIAARISDQNASTALKKVLPSLVSVHAKSAKKDKTWHRVGSGFIVSSDGFIITRQTIVQFSDSLWIETIDGHFYPAIVVSRDLDHELVLLKSDLPKAFPIHFGQSKKLKPPVQVMIIGNSLGIYPSLTLGTYLGPIQMEMLHVQAWLPAGNCGAPVLNDNGEMVGMLAGRIFDKDINDSDSFISSAALPVEVVKTFVNRTIHSIKRSPIWVGLTVANLEKEIKGVLVVDVIPGGPADQALITVGDTIVTMNHIPVENGQALIKQIHQLSSNKIIHFSILKNQETIIHTVHAIDVFLLKD